LIIFLSFVQVAVILILKIQNMSNLRGSLRLIYETSHHANTTCVSLRGNNIQDEVYHAWFKDRVAAWLRAGWSPFVIGQPAKFVSGEWCSIVELSAPDLELDQLLIQEIR
jgi:hypothetical protein